MNCERFREGLATLAEGGTDPDAARHVAACAPCAARLTVERRIVGAARLMQVDPPADLVAQAYGFMPARPRLVARLLGNGLAASGARRSRAERFSLYLAAEGVDVDLQYAPVEGGWEIVGRAPSSEWSVVRREASLPCDALGRFRLTVPDLDDAAFTLRGPDADVEVPAAGIFLDREP